MSILRTQRAELKRYWDVLVRALFCLYYLPVIALAIALVHSCLESTVYVLVFPVLGGLEKVSMCLRDGVVAAAASNGTTTFSGSDREDELLGQGLLVLWGVVQRLFTNGEGNFRALVHECGGDASWGATVTSWTTLIFLQGSQTLATAQLAFGQSTSTVAALVECAVLGFSGAVLMAVSVFVECLKLVLVLLPQACIALSAVVIGHKLIKGVTEAMVDSYSRLEDGKDYPLLAARLRFATHSRRRWFVLLSVLSLSMMTVGMGILVDTKDRFARGHVEVATAIWLSSIICGSYIVYTAIVDVKRALGNGGGANNGGTRRTLQVLPPPDREWNRYAFVARPIPLQCTTLLQPATSPSSKKDPDPSSLGLGLEGKQDDEVVNLAIVFTGVWWRGHIHRVRHLAIGLLAVFAFGWVITEGPMTAVIRSTELMVLLNIPHLFSFITLTITCSVIYKLHSLWWCLRHWRRYGVWILLAMAPHAAMIGYAILYVIVGYARLSYFGAEGDVTLNASGGGKAYFASLVALSSMVVLLFFKSVQLAREFDVLPTGGRVRWIEVLPMGMEPKAEPPIVCTSPSAQSERKSISLDLAHPSKFTFEPDASLTTLELGVGSQNSSPLGSLSRPLEEFETPKQSAGGVGGLLPSATSSISSSGELEEDDDDDQGSSMVSPSTFDMSLDILPISEEGRAKRHSWRRFLARSKPRNIAAGPLVPRSPLVDTIAPSSTTEANGVTRIGPSSIRTTTTITSSELHAILKARQCRPVPAPYAVALDDAFERRQEEVGVVGLDVSVSLARMELYRRGQPVPSTLVRVEVDREEIQRNRRREVEVLVEWKFGKEAVGKKVDAQRQRKNHGRDLTGHQRALAEQPPKINPTRSKAVLAELAVLNVVWHGLLPFVSNRLRSKVITLAQLHHVLVSVRSSFLLFALPRLFLMDASDNLSGKRFSNARVAIRTFFSSLILVFFALTIAVVAQTSFPFLHPAPVTVLYHDLNGQEQQTPSATSHSATIDHLLVKLKINGRGNATSNSNSEKLRANRGEPSDADDEDDLYPHLCQSVHGNNISVFELAWLSLIPYLPHEDDMGELLAFLNQKMDTQWRIVTGNGTTSNRGTDNAMKNGTSPRGTWPSRRGGYLTQWQGFVDFYCPDRDTHVVSVRGTDLTSSLDMIQDINMFFEATFFQLVSSVVPGASLLPTSLVTDFIKLSSLTDAVSESSAWSALASSMGGGVTSRPSPRKIGHLLHSASKTSIEREYYLQVLAYVEQLQAQRTSTPAQSGRRGVKGDGGGLLLTGHSLGGSIAHVVATRSNTRSVGFNNPGIILAHKKFGIADVSAIHRLTTTILATHDLVPLIGWQGGGMHHVECGAQVRELCHAMEFMIASLWRNCVSIRRRFSSIGNVE